MAYMTSVDEAISHISLEDVLVKIPLDDESVKPQTKAAPEQKAEAAPEQKTEAAPEQKAEAAPELKAEAAPEQKAEAAPEQKTEAAPEQKTKYLLRSAYVPKDRILYFYSRNSDILQCAMNDGNRLWDLILGLPAIQYILGKQEIIQNDESYNDPTKDKPVLEFDPDQPDRMALLRECKQLVPLSEYYENPTLTPPACLYMTDFGTTAAESTNTNEKNQAQLVKWFLDHPRLRNSVLLISSPYNAIPDGFEDRVYLIDVPPLDLEDITGLILNSVTFHNEEQRSEVALIARRYLGLSRKQVEAILSQLEMNLGVTCEAFVLNSDPPNLREDCRKESLRLIAEEKKQMLKKHPAVVYLDTTENTKAVGMSNYEDWLDLNKEYFIQSASVAPRGIVFVGPPGTGKTLMARRTAQEFDCPAVEFSLAMVKSSKYGGSTKNLEKYLSLLEDAAPIVVLLDEAEKHLAYGSDPHEVTASLIGMLLSWMQKHNKSIFLYFTSNDISRMPPELRRPGGRVDAIYFSGMPWSEELSCILQANLVEADANAKEDGRDGLLAADLIESFKNCREAGKPHDSCRQIIEEFADLAKEENRDILLTGADLKQIIQDTRKLLDNKKKRELRKAGKPVHKSMPFELEEFKQAMYDYVRRDYSATGERAQDMAAVVELYRLSKENSYRPVSDRRELENILRRNLTKLPELTFDWKYDKLLYTCIGKKLIELNKKINKS